MTLKKARRELRKWRFLAGSRRRRLRFARERSKLPWAQRKERIERFTRLTRTAERKVDELQRQVDRLSGKARAKAIYREAAKTGAEGRRYVFGGGHGMSFGAVNRDSWLGLDCSSSTWLALRRAGAVQTIMAPHSSQFGGMSGMVPGRGKWVSVYYNGQHVWTRFHGLGMWWRFDTSPWGSGGRGPRMRVGPRSTRGFRVCHPRGC